MLLSSVRTFDKIYQYELKIRSSSLFVSRHLWLTSWQITMPLYNSSEVFVPAKQYGNTIHSPWNPRALFTFDHICKRTLSFQAIHLSAQ